MKKTGLILEGGGSRGIFTSGALDFLMEKEVYFPYVAGVSFGACNAISYMSKDRGRTRDCTILPEDFEPIMGLRYFLKHKQFMDMDRIFDKFPNEEFLFDYDTFFQSDMQCELVVTNCLTGKAEYLSETVDRKRVMDICRASSSLPFVAPITYIDHTPYLDGGIADSIPIRRALHKGYKKNVIILTRNSEYRKGISKHMDHLVRLKYKEYPEFIKTYLSRPKIYNKTLDLIEDLESRGKVFVLRPQIPMISRSERKKELLTTIYQHGYACMEDQYENLLRYLEN